MVMRLLMTIMFVVIIIMMLVQVDFSLPYTEFLPDVVPFVFRVSGETLELCTFLPETNTSHDILASLDNSVLQVMPQSKGTTRCYRCRFPRYVLLLSFDLAWPLCLCLFITVDQFSSKIPLQLRVC